jgi:hypothetical protein
VWMRLGYDIFTKRCAIFRLHNPDHLSDLKRELIRIVSIVSYNSLVSVTPEL